MDLDKYKNNGWGLSKKAFKSIEEHLILLQDNINIIEFGSGISTDFLADYKLYYNKNIYITSFDNSYDYCYKNLNNHKFVDLKIRELVTCNNDIYEDMFKNKKIDFDKMIIKKDISTTRQINCFYNIKNNDLKDNYNFVIIDGPNGNGRNFAFLVLLNKLKKGSYILIDDYNHYDFVPRMKSLYNCELILQNDGDFRNNKWNNGGAFVLYKII
jgi:hypothetical protein